MHIQMAPFYVRALAVQAFGDVDRIAAELRCTVEEVGAMWVSGEPVPAARTGGNGKRRFKDPKTERYQNAVRDASVAAQLPAVGLGDDEAAIVVAHLFCSRTNSRERTKKRRERHCDVSGPDVDNVGKSLLDGMQLDGGPIADDNRVCSLSIHRRLTGDWCGPGALVVLARVMVLDQ